MSGYLVYGDGRIERVPECDPKQHVWEDHGAFRAMRCDKCLTMLSVRKDLVCRITEKWQESETE